MTQYFAIKLKGVSCKITYDDSNNSKLAYNDWFNGGSMKVGKETYYWVTDKYYPNQKKIENSILGHCRESQADMVFMFLTGAVFLVTALLLFLRRRKGY